jgi:hypothetical protein
MCSTVRRLIGATALAAVALTMVSPAEATTPLSAPELADLFLSTANVVDLSLLPYLTGTSAKPVFKATATAGDSSWANWSGSLVGQTGALSFSLSRMNGAMDAATGAMSWTTAGSLGAGGVTGAVTSSIAFPTGSTFALTLHDSLSFGGRTATADLTFTGTIQSPTGFMLGSPAAPGSGGGLVTVSVNGVNDLNDFWGPPPIIEWWINPDGTVRSRSTSDLGGKLVVSEDLLPPPGTTYTETSVPEPATWTMLMLGFAGLGFAARRRARSTPAPDRDKKMRARMIFPRSVAFSRQMR